MHVKAEHAVGTGITIGLIFVVGVCFGAGLLTGAEMILAALVSVILGFMPVATLFRKQKDTGGVEPDAQA